MAADPWAAVPDRAEKHFDRRMQLVAVADAFRLDLVIPEMYDSTPGGPFAKHALRVPLSRIPTGGSVLHTLPSLLDYALASLGCCKDSFLAWEGMPADHALFGMRIKCAAPRGRGRETCWIAKDHRKCVKWLQDTEWPELPNAQRFESWSLGVQERFADMSTCAERRAQRWPQELVELHHQRSCTKDKQMRAAIHRQALEMRIRVVAERRARRMVTNVNRGKAVCSAKKLYEIEGVMHNDAVDGSSRICRSASSIVSSVGQVCRIHGPSLTIS